MSNKKCIALLASTQDAASMNVYNILSSNSLEWKPTPIEFEETTVYVKEFPHYYAYLLLTPNKSVYVEHIDVEIEDALSTPIDALIFLTKHDSKSGRPSFSVHTQGNWNKNELGGNPKEIAVCPVILKHILFKQLELQNTKSKLDGFEVVNECTHHGPSIAVPSMFIEIGSTQKEWVDANAGEVLANALNAGLTIYSGELDANYATKPTIIGLGGTHTCSNFARLVSEEKVLLSHVCPTYAIDTLTADMIKQAISKSTTTNTIMQPLIVIDWKGMSAPQREHVIALLTSENMQYIRISELKTQLDSQ